MSSAPTGDGACGRAAAFENSTSRRKSRSPVASSALAEKSAGSRAPPFRRRDHRESGIPEEGEPGAPRPFFAPCAGVASASLWRAGANKRARRERAGPEAQRTGCGRAWGSACKTGRIGSENHPSLSRRESCRASADVRVELGRFAPASRGRRFRSETPLVVRRGGRCGAAGPTAPTFGKSGRPIGRAVCTSSVGSHQTGRRPRACRRRGSRPRGSWDSSLGLRNGGAGGPGRAPRALLGRRFSAAEPGDDGETTV